MKAALYILFSILIPVFIVLTGNVLDKRKINIIHIAVATVCANTVIGIILVVQGNKWPMFDLWIISSIISIILDRLIFKLKDGYLKCQNVLEAVLLGCICVSVYSILTYGQTIINSDTATAIILSESIKESGSWFPETWNYANGEIWTISIWPECIIPSSLMTNQSLARAAGSCLMVLLAIVSIIYINKNMFKCNAFVIAIPVMLVYLSGNSDTYIPDMILYQAAYTSQTFRTIICIALAYSLYKWENKKRVAVSAVLYSVYIVLLTMGGTRTLADQIIPIICAVFALVYFENRNHKTIDIKKILVKPGRALAFSIIPAAIGMGIYNWLCSWHNVNNSVNNAMVFVGSVKEVFDNLIQAVLNMFVCFGFDGGSELVSLAGIKNLVSVIMYLIMCIVVPVLQGLKYKKETEEVRFFYLFTLAHNLIMILVVAFFGKTTDRYMLTSVLMFVLMSARYIYVYWIEQRNWKRYIWVTLFVLATLIECTSLGLNSMGWTDTLDAKKEINERLVEQNIAKGYATYWNAYNNEIYSDLRVKFGAVNVTEKGIEPFLWLVDSKVFYPEEDINTCLMLNETENEAFSDNVEDIFGEPVYSYAELDMYIYVFDYDIAEHIFNGKSVSEINSGSILNIAA